MTLLTQEEKIEMLLAACRQAMKREYNSFEPDNQSEFYFELLLTIAKAEGTA